MRVFNATSPRQLDAGLALLRIVTGSVFAVHGGQKLFVYGFAGVTGAFEGMGIPMASIAGPAVALLEFFGGLALIAGLLVRPIAAGLAADMLGAVLLVHWPSGFFLPNGYEFVGLLFGAAAALSLVGAGAWSVDAVIARKLTTRSAAETRDVRRNPSLAQMS